MDINLKDCKLITSAEYLLLENPIWKGQTRLDKFNQYYMVWECDGILYKTINTL